MSKWIPFSEREPSEDEKVFGLWFAKHNQRRSLPWSSELSIAVYEEARFGYTHFCPVTPPTDLPPKPLPQLSEGSKWGKDRAFPSIMREGSRYWISADGGSLVVNAAYAQNADSIPLADIEALKEAGK